ncbi:MAG TPA: hypothetical protein VMV26_08840 [Alphaproteobacteria bacterium]|nr:hypothetical protein [Alphaproteobacteria bacterium]
MSNVVYASVAAIVVLLAGVIVRPSPSATVLAVPASATIDVYDLQRTIDVKSLPEQQFYDLI